MHGLTIAGKQDKKMGDYKIREATEDEIKKASGSRSWNIRQGAGWLLGLKVPNGKDPLDYTDFPQLRELTQKIIDHLKKLEKPVDGTPLKNGVWMYERTFLISTDNRFTRSLPIAFYYQLVAERKIDWNFEQFPKVLSLYGNRVFTNQHKADLSEQHGVPIQKTVRLAHKLYVKFWKRYDEAVESKNAKGLKEPRQSDIKKWIEKNTKDQDCIDLLNVIQGKLRNHFEKLKQNNK
jgi:hypothetical protein